MFFFKKTKSFLNKNDGSFHKNDEFFFITPSEGATEHREPKTRDGDFRTVKIPIIILLARTRTRALQGILLFLLSQVSHIFS